ncbi:M23 family metallopeptidase [Cytophagaceae bacterium ABcell3]|nr:M23 family metallopeptidase [Cytophagaceae bacterium ABcell3]
MKNKKTIYKWLTNRFLLIIRNEENFAEKRTYSFNYAKLIVFSILFLSLVTGACFFVATTALAKWFNPRYQQIETNKKVISLSIKADSLLLEVQRKDMFIANIRKVIAGEILEYSEDSVVSSNQKQVQAANLDEVSDVDKELRARFESGGHELSYFEQNAGGDLNDIFVKPVSGIPVNGQVEGGNLLRLKVGKKESVKSVAEGKVLFTSWTLEDQHIIAVLHPGNFISFYKNVSVVLKKNGDSVKAGEVIAKVGDSDEDAQVVSFELWHEGVQVNPQDYILF